MKIRALCNVEMHAYYDFDQSLLQNVILKNMNVIFEFLGNESRNNRIFFQKILIIIYFGFFSILAMKYKKMIKLFRKKLTANVDAMD